MRKITFVGTTGLAQAFAIAAKLQGDALIQSAAPSSEVCGIEVLTFPDDSPSHTEREGGAKGTEEHIKAAFATCGYKEYQAPKGYPKR